MLGTILLVFAFVLFCLAAYGFDPARPKLGWLGLAFWVLAILLGGVGIHVGK